MALNLEKQLRFVSLSAPPSPTPFPIRNTDLYQYGAYHHDPV